MLTKLLKAIECINQKGIPLPLIRINGVPTFTGTMAFISFNTALFGQLGKISKIVGDVDLTQANYLFLMCLGAYLGNKTINTDGKNVKVEELKKE